MEASSAALMTFGLATLLVSWIVLLIAAWKDDYTWGIFAVLLPPLAYFYALFRLDKAGQSLLLAAIGWFMLYLAF